MSGTPSFPPLMWGEAADGPAFDHARARAREGCDAGLVAYRLRPDTLEASLVFAPEVPLREAAVMLPLCGVGFQNALGALAPPEVAVHLEWTGGIRVNGATCGEFRIAAASEDPDAVPDWLVIALTVPLWPEDDAPGGDTPERTTLYAEGCSDVPAPALLEAYARHTLNWIDRWEDAGPKALHAEWRALVHGIGEPTAQVGQSGIFLGVDENFGMLLQTGGTTRLIPLTALLETPR